MSLKITVIAMAAGLSAAGLASPVAAQTSAPAQAPVPARKISVSKEALKAIKEYQDAVNAKDVVNMPAKLAAAQAVAKSADDHYVIGQLRLQAAAASKDDAQIASAIEALFATNSADPHQVAPLYLNLARIQYNAKQFDKAAASFEKVLAQNPNHTDAMVELAETRFSQGRAADAVNLIQKGIATKLAAGQKPDESWYKRGLRIAFNAQLPAAMEISRQWITAYPSATSWRDGLLVYRRLGKPDGAANLDVLRLQRAVDALEGSGDYELYAYEAVEGRAPSEAKTVLEEAIAAKKIDANAAIFREVLPIVRKAAAGEQQGLAERQASAEAAPKAAAAMAVANASFGLGQYDKAAQLYRMALTKPGADADLINLRLGIALARKGDKAGATEALKAVTGARSELAKYWLIYVSSQA